jgi:hypothetical protein
MRMKIIAAALLVDALSSFCVYALGLIWYYYTSMGTISLALTNPLELLVSFLAVFPLMLFLSYKVLGGASKNEDLTNSPKNNSKGDRKHDDFY